MSSFRPRVLICLFLWAFSVGAGHATTVIPPAFPELVNESDYIVRAVVASTRSAWAEKQGRRSIFTYVELKVLEVIAGTPPQPLVLEILGGQVGDEEMVVHGMPTFAVGQEDVLFIRGNGKQFYPLTAAMHGRYPVAREQNGAASMRRSNDQPLRRTEEVGLPLEHVGSAGEEHQSAQAGPGLSLKVFVEKIRAAVDANHRRPQA
jgi:hypothetical protein